MRLGEADPDCLLLADESFVMDRIEALAENAEALDQFLWVDMESSKFTDRTIDVYLRILEKHPRVGVAIQAYLKRSGADVTRLLDAGARVRLVKGAYRESPDLVFPSRDGVRRSFSTLMDLLFKHGKGFAIATHDSRLIDEARVLSARYGTDFEFQMLKGIRDDLKPELVASGLRVAEYIPYGDEWYAYSMRRMKEHPSNVWLLFRSML